MEWLGRIGKYLRQAREETSLTRYQVADAMGVHVDEVRFLEVGLPTQDEIKKLAPLYATAPGKPELYSQFEKQFG